MFAIPQLRPIFLSLFVSSVLFPMERTPHTTNARRQNIPVASQSGFSCGYHSLLNSVFSIKDIDQSQANKIINEKFAQEDGAWRSCIIKMRKEKLVKNYIKAILHQCMLPHTQEEEIRKLNDAERIALDRIANAYATAFVLNETLNILKENPKNLEERLQELVKQDRPHIEDQEIQNISHCIQLLDLNILPRTIVPAHEIIKQACWYADVSNRELRGDNLDSFEMETLKDLALKEYHIANGCISIVEDTSRLDEDAYQDMLKSAKEQILKTDCTISFCVRTSANTNRNKQTLEQLHADTKGTHWFSVTLKRKNGQNKYLFKDSMGEDYINHHNSLQLIKALEPERNAQVKTINDNAHNNPNPTGESDSKSNAEPSEPKVPTNCSPKQKENIQKEEASAHSDSSNFESSPEAKTEPSEPKIPTKKNPIYSSDSDDSSEYDPIDFTKKRSSYNKSSKPKRTLRDEKVPTYGEQPYQPKGRYSDPNEINSNYNKFIEAAPDRIKSLLRGLKRPKQAERMGCLKKLLLHGAPGDGKTSLAKAMALEVYGKYYFIPTPFLLTSWKNCHTDLLLEINPLIEKGEPIVIIFDEIDELSNQHKNHNSSDASMPKAFCLLLDYCKEKAPFLFIIGTTNNEPDDFLPALISRFGSNKIHIPHPNALIRKNILDEQLREEENNLDEIDKIILVEQLDGRSCRDIIDILEQSSLYSFETDGVVTLEMINLAIENNPLLSPEHQRVAQSTGSTEAEAQEAIANKVLLGKHHETVDFLLKKKGINLQQASLDQAATQYQGNLDQQAATLVLQTRLNLMTKSRDRSVQVNGNVGTGGASIGGSVTHSVVTNDDYEAHKNILPDKEAAAWDAQDAEAQARVTAQAQANQQNQPNQQGQQAPEDDSLAGEYAKFFVQGVGWGAVLGGPTGAAVGGFYAGTKILANEKNRGNCTIQ